jgi:hypothetical protein
MNREDIIRLAIEHTVSGLKFDEDGLVRFAQLVATAEREACVDLLMGLHEAQSNNGAHNYYHFASNALKELRGKSITIKTKQFKCTGCHGKWHNPEDAKHHSCKDFQ